MNPEEYSYNKINYNIRPSKHVERKIFIELLHRLSKIGISISDYCYIGLGSIFYVDFILFHKYLFIDEMICAENSDIPKRMRFNKPYKFIKLKMQSFSQLIPSLSKNKKYLIWLDYDQPLDKDKLQDLDGLLVRLTEGIIIFITVDAQPRSDPKSYPTYPIDEIEDRICDFYNDEFQFLLDTPVKRNVLNRKDLPILFAKIIRSQIKISLSSRSEHQFIQLINFKYADGAQMLTIGGIIGDKILSNNLKHHKLLQREYINQNESPKEITIPPLTYQEINWFNCKIKQKGRTNPPFEIDARFIENFKKYYRHYPNFHDLLF